MSVINNPMFGISAQRYHGKKSDCWLIRLFYRDGVPQFCMSISMKRGEQETLKWAQALRDFTIKKALDRGIVSKKYNSLKQPRFTKRNKSGISGVTLVKQGKPGGKKHFQFRVSFNRDGKVNMRSIGVLTRGWEEAFKYAVEMRRDKELELYGCTLIPAIRNFNIGECLNTCLKRYSKQFPELKKEIIK